jgi:hypothetical protein
VRRQEAKQAERQRAADAQREAMKKDMAEVIATLMQRERHEREQAAAAVQAQEAALQRRREELARQQEQLALEEAAVRERQGQVQDARRQAEAAAAAVAAAQAASEAQVRQTAAEPVAVPMGAPPTTTVVVAGGETLDDLLGATAAAQQEATDRRFAMDAAMARYGKAAQAHAEVAQKHAVAVAAGDADGAAKLETELAAHATTLRGHQDALVALGGGANTQNAETLVMEGALMNWAAVASEYATVLSQQQEARARGETDAAATLEQQLHGLAEQKAALEQEVKRRMTAGASVGAGGTKRTREARGGREADESDGGKGGGDKATAGWA